jgi:aminoacyl tRNA synthase complex-interacting multifunctional protein 1
MSLSLAREDAVTGLVAAALGVQPADTIDGQMSALTLADGAAVQGPNTVISTLVGASDQAAARIGGSALDQAEIQQWLAFTAAENVSSNEQLLELNTFLANKVYLVTEDWTVADLAAVVRLRPIIAAMDAKKRSTYCHITRYFDHLQHLDVVAKYSAFEQVEIDTSFDKSVTVAIKKGAPKDAVPKEASKADPATTVADAKQAKKDKKAAKPAATKAETVISPSLVSFKVGLIEKAELHPDAESLYVSTVNLGESEPRTVVSGLVKYIPLEQMQKRLVVCVCNLKPAAMRGVKSSAMVLAASPTPVEGQEKDHVELVQPPAGSKPGDVLHFAGFEGEPEAQLNPKKKIFEAVQVGFTTDKDLQVLYKDPKTEKSGLLVNKSGEVCKVESLIGASIR